MKLLVVEDEEVIQNIISKGLKKKGYAIDQASNGKMALELFAVNEYDLIILDLNLPQVDGMEVLKQIRELNQEIKILILSARSQVEDKIKGLDGGSNDYMVKPFDFFELEARIRNLLRRNFIQLDTKIEIQNVILDSAKKEVLIGQTKVNLTRKEYAILEYLMLNHDHVISAEQLMEHVWESEMDLFSNTLKYHVSSLKKKLSFVGIPKEFIQNLRGQGYVIYKN